MTEEEIAIIFSVVKFVRKNGLEDEAIIKILRMLRFWEGRLSIKNLKYEDGYVITNIMVFDEDIEDVIDSFILKNPDSYYDEEDGYVGIKVD